MKTYYEVVDSDKVVIYSDRKKSTVLKQLSLDDFTADDECVELSGKDWSDLTLMLFNSKSFQYAMQNPSLVNGVAYTTLLKVLTDGKITGINEVYLSHCLPFVMSFSNEQKDEVNGILELTNFSTRI